MGAGNFGINVGGNFVKVFNDGSLFGEGWDTYTGMYQVDSLQWHG